MLLKLSSTPMDPRLRFFISNNLSWELNITTTNFMAYLQQTGTPHDALLAKTLMHLSTLFASNPEELFVG